MMYSSPSRFNGPANYGNYQFRPRAVNNYPRQWGPIGPPPSTPQQPRSCPKCGLKPHQNINFCPAINLVCWQCGRRGHLSRVCRAFRGFQGDFSQNYRRFQRPRSHASRGRYFRNTAPNLQNTIIHQPMQRRNYMIAHINNKPVKTLIDSGSVVTLITERFANKHKLPVTPTSDPAIRIEREKTSGGKKLYLVLFKDKSKFWCSQVSDGLLQEYRIRKSRNRRRKRM